MTPAYKALKKLKKVMGEKICFVGKCTKVEKALKQVGKVAKTIQKPLELALKKTIDPIL